MSNYPKTAHHDEFGNEILDEEKLIEDTEDELLQLDDEDLEPETDY